MPNQEKMGKKSRKPRGGGGGAKPSPPTGPFDGSLVDGVTNIMSYAMMVAEDAKGDITTERAYSGACLCRDVPSCDECWLEGVPLKRCQCCKVAKYCSTECQKKAWNEELFSGHKKTCKQLRK